MGLATVRARWSRLAIGDLRPACWPFLGRNLGVRLRLACGGTIVSVISGPRGLRRRRRSRGPLRVGRARHTSARRSRTSRVAVRGGTRRRRAATPPVLLAPSDPVGDGLEAAGQFSNRARSHRCRDAPTTATPRRVVLACCRLAGVSGKKRAVSRDPARPGTNTTGNSRPFAWWIVITMNRVVGGLNAGLGDVLLGLVEQCRYSRNAARPGSPSRGGSARPGRGSGGGCPVRSTGRLPELGARQDGLGQIDDRQPGRQLAEARSSGSNRWNPSRRRGTSRWAPRRRQGREGVEQSGFGSWLSESTRGRGGPGRRGRFRPMR